MSLKPRGLGWTATFMGFLGLCFSGALYCSEPTDLSSVESWLAQQIKQVRHAAEDERPRLVVQTLSDLEEQLVATGLDPRIAESLSDPGVIKDQEAIGNVVTLTHAHGRLQRYNALVQREDRLSPPDAREHTQRILDNPVFQTKTPQASLLHRGMEALRQQLYTVFAPVGRLIADNSILALALLALLVVLVVALGFWLLWRLTQRGGHRHSQRADLQAYGPMDETAAADELLARSKAELASGNFRAALVLLDAAVAAGLRSAGLLPPTPGLTNFEGLRLLQSAGPGEIQTDFRELMRIHDRGVYAGVEIDAQDMQQAVGLAETILSIAAETER